MRTITILAAAATVLGLAAAGCGGGSSATKETAWEGEAKANAVYATQVPLYPGARIGSMMGSDTYGDGPDSHREGMAWWYDVAATQAELDAWYAPRLAGAAKSTGEDGGITYTLAPQGGEPGEELGVILENNQVRVFERTRAGKRKG
jgi:hypothetical protein